MSSVNEDIAPISLATLAKRRKWLLCDPASPTSQVAEVALQDRLKHVPDMMALVANQCGQIPDSVRQLRVATRRATTAINLFSEFVTPANASRVSRDLKKIRKAAGRLRDLDVLIESTRSRDPNSAHLTQLKTRRDSAHVKLQKSYRKYVESGRLAEDTQQLLASVPNVKSPEETRPFEEWARPALIQTATSFFSSWPTPQGSEAEDFIALHNFRLQVKQLRYQIELLGRAMPKKRRKKVHRKLKSLQTALGTVNDHDVSMQSILRWLRDADAEQQSQLEAQLDHERAARTQAVTDFHAVWTAEKRDKLKSRFDRVFATKDAE